MPHAALGQFCWPELHTSDLPAARAFYGELLGWEWAAVATAGGQYLLAGLGAEAVGGALQAPPSMGPPRWHSYLRVADADTTAAAAREAGARITAGPYEVEAVGRMAWLEDPTGAAVALWQSRGHEGATAFGCAGALCWMELATADLGRAEAFYGRVFGWRFRPREGTPRPYLEAGLPAAPFAGLYARTHPGGRWLPYFGVDELPAAIARARRAGATERVAPTDLGEGLAFAIMRDPQGASFGLLSTGTPLSWT